MLWFLLLKNSKMTAFICTRFAQSILVLFIMSLLVFGGVNLVGDPVEMLINPEADQAEVERVIRELGLDRPVTEQYWYFLVNAFLNLPSNFVRLSTFVIIFSTLYFFSLNYKQKIPLSFTFYSFLKRDLGRSFW